MPSATTRVVAVDVARCLALLGILVNHLVGGLASAILWDVHAVLFAVLVGVGAQLGSTAHRRGSTVAAGAVRATALAVVGLSLAELETRAAIVLVNLAVVTLAVTWAARRSTVVVGAVAVGIALVAPVLAHLARGEMQGPWHPDVAWSDLEDPTHALATLLVATSYPALLWTVLGLLGVLAARAYLPGDGRPARPAALALTGLGLVLVGRVGSILALVLTGRTALLEAEQQAALEESALPDDLDRLSLVGAYLPSTPSLLVSGGLALLVLAGVLGLCRSDRVRGSLVVRAAADVGSMTLSAYALHVLMLPCTEVALDAWPGLDPWWLYLAHVTVIAVALLTWRRTLRRPASVGPLEWPTRAAISAVTRRSGPTPAPGSPRRPA